MDSAIFSWIEPLDAANPPIMGVTGGAGLVLSRLSPSEIVEKYMEIRISKISFFVSNNKSTKIWIISFYNLRNIDKFPKNVWRYIPPSP